jgi:carbon monoxide dehydrogenase subunit G
LLEQRVQSTFLIEAKPEVVWDILTDPNYIPKLYPDMLNIVVDPPGRATVGQYRTLSGRAGKRLIEFKTKVAELVPMQRFVIAGRRGGAFESFSEVIELEEVKKGTMVGALFLFKLSVGYFGPGFDLLALEKAARFNEEMHVKNLKELSELKHLGPRS